MRVLTLVTAILGSAVALPVADEYTAVRTVCPSFMLNCECTTTTTGVIVSCTGLDWTQLKSTIRDLRGLNLRQFTMTDSKLLIQSGDFSEVALYNMDVESSSFKVGRAADGFLVGDATQLRALKFHNSTMDFGETDSVHTKLSTLWFSQSEFRNYHPGWFHGLSVEWLRIEKCPKITQSIAGGLKELKKYSHIKSNLKELQRHMLPLDSNTVEELDFSNNEIVSVADDFIDGLPNLNRLDLSNNKLTTLSEKTFRNFNKTVILSNNPLECNSSLLWLARRLDDNSLPQPYRVTCVNADGRRQSVRDLLKNHSEPDHDED